MAKNPRAYHSEKRKKELARQKKQEEKRLNRLNKKTESDEDGVSTGETEAAEGADTEPAGGTAE